MANWTNMCGKSCATCSRKLDVCHTPAGYYLGKYMDCRATNYMTKAEAEALLLSTNKGA